MRSPDFSENNRVVRVFISSTFQDMHAERDELVKFVFPELRRRCRERGVEFVDVDLRWGITDEQKAEGKVLPICLAEIERCRPYFIGLLGERYGWLPQDISEELIRIQPWLREHKEKSVTELEIIHGVLQDPGMKGLAFFYMRDHALSQQVEAQLVGKADYQPETPESAAKLIALKAKIRNSEYPVRENYQDAKALGALVLEDLWKVIDERFSLESIPSPLERERMEHAAFSETRRKVYIGREEYFRRLDAHIDSEDQPLVILGESGSGKSALLANWAAHYRQQHPEDFMVEHYIGSQADSADHVRILRRIMKEIQARYEPKSESTAGMIQSGKENVNEIPVDPKKVVEVFPVWLAKAAARGRFILILDALNQVEDRDNSPELGWLPRYFPPNVRVILSTLPGRSLNALKERDWPLFSLDSLNKDERKQIIVSCLGRYSRSLSAAHTDRITTASQSGNPLFLKVLLDELRMYGDHRTLGDRIGYYLGAATIGGLYERILTRYEQDYEFDRPGLVRDAMSLIWASRRGLFESELLELLGTDGSPLRRAFWSSLFLAAEEALVSKSGMLNFFHDYLRTAVEARYLKSKELQQAAHLRLADYFEKRQLEERKIDELPWQLRQAESWERLKDCTTDVKTFLVLLREKQYELVGYWLVIGNRFDMAQEYLRMLDTYEKTAPARAGLANILNETALFLVLNAKYAEAEPLYRRALEIFEKALGKDHPNTATSLNNLAGLYYSQGRYVEAEPPYHRALEIFEKALGKDHPDTATYLNNLAELYYTQGRYAEAEPLHRRALEIFEKALGKDHPDTATYLNNLAELYSAQGRYVEAEPLHRRALEIREQALGKDHPDTATSLNNLAGLYYSQGRYVEAKPPYHRALEIREQGLGKDHPNTAISLNNLAGLYYAQGRYTEAEPLYRRALEIFKQALDKDHPDAATSLNSLAVLYYAQGRYTEAEPLLCRALEILKQALGKDHPDTAISLNSLAVLYFVQGRYAEAEPLLRRALEIREKALGKDHPDTAISLNSLAGLYYAQGRYTEAEPLYRRALETREKVLPPEHPDTVQIIFALAQLLRDKSEHPESASLYRRIIAVGDKLCERNEYMNSSLLEFMAFSHNNIAFHTDVPAKNWKETEAHYRKSIELFERLANPVEAANVKLNLMILFHASGQNVEEYQVRDLTQILDAAKDKRAEKGHKLLQELLTDKTG